MKLKKAKITNYRSVKDSGWIEFEPGKTIFVGPNEAGKTALLRALQQINPPNDVPNFAALRDYPRGDYNQITRKEVDPAHVDVVVAHFEPSPEDRAAVAEEFRRHDYVCGRRLDNSFWHKFEGAPGKKTTDDIKKDLQRFAAHVDSRVEALSPTLSEQLSTILDKNYWLSGAKADAIKKWLEKHYPHLDESNAAEEERYDRLVKACDKNDVEAAALDAMRGRLPLFVLFSNYFRVRPLIHLEHLATRIEKKLLDDDQYDYGNQCLLNLLGFSARELSDLGKAAEPGVNDADALQDYRDQLDRRSYQLNAASVQLTREIVKVWNPNPDRAEADRLRITADGQYLKVVVEDDLGVEIELDQRSEGFQWLVSFFVVFFSETKGKHANAILLLDEPGLSLHALKQRDFRDTISKLAEVNQTVFTTHSPFLVGPGELDLVRVIEMKDRTAGTKAHTTVTADDPAALLPLQEALGYDLAQSLFAHQRNLVLEGLTDFWYLEATAELLRASGHASLNEKIALISANKASKVVYFATILHAHNLKVAALLDSDAAGDQAAQQDVLVNALGAKRIIRTRDNYTGPVSKPEIEDLLRETLVLVAKKSLGWDISNEATAMPGRPIVDIFEEKVPGFSKYKLAKAYVRWTRENDATSLAPHEQTQWSALMTKINQALK
ncbi:AAA family ATPase [Neorhizobium tomejilense]|uniref:AAA family ATPase n=1 Tax=Neorhizobium tomejilense TaxID=2093828 RepID=UPI000CF9DBBE|nr:AAA family ATPase [Neorhizobium tomejilense]